MPTVSGFETPIDDRGFPYRAVRATRITSGLVTPSTPLALTPLATTKVVRVCCGRSECVRVYFTGTSGSCLVGGGVPQDFVIWPGINLTLVASPNTATATASITECG